MRLSSGLPTVLIDIISEFKPIDDEVLVLAFRDRKSVV